MPCYKYPIRAGQLIVDVHRSVDASYEWRSQAAPHRHLPKVGCATFDSNVALVEFCPVTDIESTTFTTTMSSSVKQESKVSFTIRRPTPSSSRATSTGPDSDAAATSPHASAPSFKIPALPRHLTDQGAGSRSGSNSPKPRARTYEERGEESDSSEEERMEDELVTGFDQFGVQRCVFLHFDNAIFSTCSTFPTFILHRTHTRSFLPF